MKVGYHPQLKGCASEEDLMAEQVERERTFEATPEEVWDAITDERLLREWLADEAELDPEPGGEVRFRIGDEERTGQARLSVGHGARAQMRSIGPMSRSPSRVFAVASALTAPSKSDSSACASRGKRE